MSASGYTYGSASGYTYESASGYTSGSGDTPEFRSGSGSGSGFGYSFGKTEISLIVAEPFDFFLTPQYYTILSTVYDIETSGYANKSSGFDNDLKVIIKNINNETKLKTYRLCGVPGFCGSDSANTCSNISISKCLDCSTAGSAMLISFLLLLALAILFGNGLVVLIFNHRKKIRDTSKIDVIRVSMAVGDMINGFLILFVTFPSYLWIMNSTFDSLTSAVVELHNSSQAISGGFFFLWSYTSSLYHLILSGAMRLYAIKWPLRYKTLSDLTVRVNLALIWIVAAVVASLPIWISKNYSFDFNSAVLMYVPSINPQSSSSSSPFHIDNNETEFWTNFTSKSSSSFSVQNSGVVALFLLLGIPYIIMTVVAIYTAVHVRKTVRSRQERFKINQSGSKNSFKHEIAAFKTLSIMQAGFSITLLPIGFVAALYYADYFACTTYSTPYMICFYLSMSNSVVNVIVYSVREKKFRSAVQKIFGKLKSQLPLPSIASTSGTNVAG